MIRQHFPKTRHRNIIRPRFKDGFFKDDESHKIAIIKKIRKYRPRIVITNALSDRHPDHPRSSQITIDACFLSGLSKIDTGQELYRPQAIYHYIQFNDLSPDFVVDITDYMDLKIKADSFTLFPPLCFIATTS